MAGTIVNTFANTGNTDVDNIELCLTDIFKGHNILSLTNMDNTTVPAIAAGSFIEVNGSLISFSSEEAISITDPHTGATVADGTVYVMIDGTNRLAYFTATSPTWSDSKQGWYGLTTWANWKYISLMIKETTSYSYKEIINKKLYSNIESCLLEDQIFPLGIDQIIYFNNKKFDLLNEFDISAYSFTPKYAGLYSIFINGMYGDSYTEGYVKIYKNGISLPSPYGYFQQVQEWTGGFSYSRLLRLSGNDIIKFYMYFASSLYSRKLYSIATILNIARIS